MGVIADGASLFGTATPRPATSAFFFRQIGHTRATPVTRLVSLLQPELETITASTLFASILNPAPLTVAAGTKRYSLYTPELNLMAETALQSNGTPPIAYEYVWFNGHPVAQIDTATSTVHYTFTDHLGTPLLLTNADGTTYWRAEYEPFGAVFALRSADVHQPLRLPGQEAEQLNLGANGVTEREYNIFRWYRGGWGQYTQPDPLGLSAGINLYRYGFSNPNTYTDPTGLFVDPSKALEQLTKNLLNSCETILTQGPKALPILAAAGLIILDATPAGQGSTTLNIPYPSKCAKKCKENNCPPCDPPIGTIGYNFHKVPPHDPHPGIVGDHVHYFQMQQIPSNCDCFWKNVHIATAPPPVPYAVPLPTSDPWP